MWHHSWPVYGLFNVLLNSVCKYFIEDFLHLFPSGKFVYSLFVCVRVSLYGLGIRILLVLEKEFRKAFLSYIFYRII
jgi:hypothetical protein